MPSFILQFLLLALADLAALGLLVASQDESLATVLVVLLMCLFPLLGLLTGCLAGR